MASTRASSGAVPLSASVFVDFWHSFPRLTGGNVFALTLEYGKNLAYNGIPWAAVGVVLFIVGVVCLSVRMCCCAQWWRRNAVRPGTRTAFFFLAFFGLVITIGIFASLAVDFQAANDVESSLTMGVNTAVQTAANASVTAQVTRDTFVTLDQQVTQYVNQQTSPTPQEQQCKQSLDDAAQLAIQVKGNVDNVTSAVTGLDEVGRTAVFYIFIALLAIFGVQLVVTLLALMLSQGYVRNCCLAALRYTALFGAALVMAGAWITVGLAVVSAAGLGDVCVSQQQLYVFMQAQADAASSGAPTPTPLPNNAFYEKGIQCFQLPTVNGTDLATASAQLFQQCESTIRAATGMSQTVYAYMSSSVVSQLRAFVECAQVLQLVGRFGVLLCGEQESASIVSVTAIFICGLVLASLYMVMFFLLVFDADVLVWTKMMPDEIEVPAGMGARRR